MKNFARIKNAFKYFDLSYTYLEMLYELYNKREPNRFKSKEAIEDVNDLIRKINREEKNFQELLDVKYQEKKEEAQQLSPDEREVKLSEIENFYNKINEKRKRRTYLELLNTLNTRKGQNYVRLFLLKGIMSEVNENNRLDLEHLVIKPEEYKNIIENFQNLNGNIDVDLNKNYHINQTIKEEDKKLWQPTREKWRAVMYRKPQKIIDAKSFSLAPEVSEQVTVYSYGKYYGYPFADRESYSNGCYDIICVSKKDAVGYIGSRVFLCKLGDVEAKLVNKNEVTDEDLKYSRFMHKDWNTKAKTRERKQSRALIKRLKRIMTNKKTSIKRKGVANRYKKDVKLTGERTKTTRHNFQTDEQTMEIVMRQEPLGEIKSRQEIDFLATIVFSNLSLIDALNNAGILGSIKRNHKTGELNYKTFQEMPKELAGITKAIYENGTIIYEDGNESPVRNLGRVFSIIENKQTKRICNPQERT